MLLKHLKLPPLTSQLLIAGACLAGAMRDLYSVVIFVVAACLYAGHAVLTRHQMDELEVLRKEIRDLHEKVNPLVLGQSWSTKR